MPFISDLDVELIDDTYWRLTGPLRYDSDLTGPVVIPAGFETDFASVPRLPVIFTLWGDRAHREAVLHDYLYSRGAVPDMSFDACNLAFYQAMESRCVILEIRYPLYWAVCLFGRRFFKQRSVMDKINP